MPFRYAGTPISAIGAPSSTVMFGEATMMSLTTFSGGVGSVRINNPIGYERIRPPFAWVPLTGTPEPRNFGNLYPRFNRGSGQLSERDQVIVGMADGSVKLRPIQSLRSAGTSAAEVDRLWNGTAN